MPDSRELRQRGPARRLLKGARNAVGSSLSVTAADVVTIIADEVSRDVAATLLAAIDEVGAKAHAFVIERHARRPLTALPRPVVDALRESTVSIYTVHPVEGEFAHRQELIGMVGPLELRHAHMIKISEDAMVQGMLTNYQRVARLNELMIEKLESARTIRVTGRGGTDVTVRLDPREKIHSAAGVIGPGEWANLPSGEVYTCPASVDGVYAVDGIIPSEKEVDRIALRARPLKLKIKDGRLQDAEGGPNELADHVKRAVADGQNVDRIGMFAVGTNYDLLMPIGDQIQDQFVPGAYFSLGRPVDVGTTAWTSSAQYAFSGRKTTLEIDGEVVIEDGRYSPDLLRRTRG